MTHCNLGKSSMNMKVVIRPINSISNADTTTVMDAQEEVIRAIVRTEEAMTIEVEVMTIEVEVMAVIEEAVVVMVVDNDEVTETTVGITVKEVTIVNKEETRTTSIRIFIHIGLLTFY